MLGLQGDLWSETLGGDGRLDYMLVPKLFGLAERAWAADPDWALERDAQKSEPLYREAWSRFVNVVGKRELPRLDRELPGFQLPHPDAGPQGRRGELRASVELPGFTLRYTTDGSEPTARSPELRGPIPLRAASAWPPSTPPAARGTRLRSPRPSRIEPYSSRRAVNGSTVAARRAGT